MKMNKVSIANSFVMFIICAVLLILLAIIFYITLPNQYYCQPLVFVIMCFIFIFQKLNIADMQIQYTEHRVVLNYLYRIQYIVFDGLRIINVGIGKHPTFRVETNIQNLRLNYTQENYDALLSLMGLTEYSEIEEFKTKVRTHFLAPKKV